MKAWNVLTLVDLQNVEGPSRVAKIKSAIRFSVKHTAGAQRSAIINRN